MRDDAISRGSFTLPGEAGHEKLTLALAERWGADTIRDSDGTRLSDALLSSGYDIYSTLCLVRADTAWARAMKAIQQEPISAAMANRRLAIHTPGRILGRLHLI